MGIHTGQSKYIRFGKKNRPDAANSWQVSFPNPADFNFNYYRLLAEAEASGIGKNPNPHLKIAIVGAGVAGLTAARELFRSGYSQIDIFEASDRLGGRTYSIPAPNRLTTFEMGAMRMPFFTEPGSEKSILDYYRQRFNISVQPFPDPGSNIADTGIYLNRGFGPHPQLNKRPELLRWDKEQTLPPTRELLNVYLKWSRFAELVTWVCQEKYNTPDWMEFWHKIVQNYWTLNFRELVYLEAINIQKYDPRDTGFFGGLGMDEAEANLFYTIGAGDGSWGAFYDISCLYPIRTLLFGFGSNHQLIQGRFDKNQRPTGASHGQTDLKDSLGQPLSSPHYLGVQTFADCLFFEPVKSHNSTLDGLSLYEATTRTARHENCGYGVNLYLKTSVNRLQWLGDARQVQLTAKPTHFESHTQVYDGVILSPTTWATQLGIQFENFQEIEGDSQRPVQIPFRVAQSIHRSHWITSCKVFYPLKERYWEVSTIPQVISTDTYLQGVYGYAVDLGDRRDPGVLLVSYTWEDDANKFLAEQDNPKFAKHCLKELDDLLVRSQNIGIPISPYVETEQPTVIQWSKQPKYRGCAKLYRETSWNDNYTLLRYNQTYSPHSHLYFAGEAFSVEGGWTEPALRGGLDAAIYLIHNTGGEFLNSFNLSNYPRYSDWNPAQPQTETVLDRDLSLPVIPHPRDRSKPG